MFPEEAVDLMVTKVSGHRSSLLKYPSECSEFVTSGIRLGVLLVPSDARVCPQVVPASFAFVPDQVQEDATNCACNFIVTP